MSEICDTANNDHMLLNGAICSTMHVTARSNTQDFTNITARGTEIIPHVAKANARKYFITILKRSGVQFDDLVECYCTFVRPLLEYAAPTRFGTQDSPSSSLMFWSRYRGRSSECYYLTPVTSKPDIYQDYQPCLSDVQNCLNFASGLARNTEFNYWLPPRGGKCHRHNLRNNNNLSTMPTKSIRFSSSPFMFFIKILNNV